MAKEQQPQIDFSELIQALVDNSTPLQARYLYRLSGLEGNELDQLKEIWPKIPTERRERLIEDLEMLADYNYLVLFDDIYKIGLTDPTPRVREISIRALWEDEDPDLAETLMEILSNDSKPSVRAQAAAGLGKYIFLGEMEEISQDLYNKIHKQLFEVASSTELETVRRRALEALGFSSDKRVNKLIEQAYNQGKEDWLLSALVAMGRSVNEQWIPIIIENLAHEENKIRIEAIQSAGEIQANQALPYLIELLQDPDSDVRLASIWALSQIGGLEARHAIESLLEETDNDEETQLIEEALDNLDITDMTLDFNFLDLSEDDLDDMIDDWADEEE